LVISERRYLEKYLAKICNWSEEKYRSNTLEEAAGEEEGRLIFSFCC